MPANEKLEELMNKYGDSIFRMCFLYLRDYHLAEDATQETFIKAMKSYDSFEHNSSEKTWLIRIAINVCQKYNEKPLVSDHEK
jgi:RNA polymerase sigma factor (sigma-70 family)